MLNYVVKISIMFAKYFEYYTIILGGGRFFVSTLYIVNRLSGCKQLALVSWQWHNGCNIPLSSV